MPTFINNLANVRLVTEHSSEDTGDADVDQSGAPAADGWRYRHTVLVLCTTAFFSTAFARLVISPVVPSIRAEFGINNALVGLALTGMWFTYAVAQFPSGVLAGRFGERRLILVAIGGSAATSLAIAVAPLFALFIVGTLVLGGVSGLHYSVAATLLSRRFENTGGALGLHNAGGPGAGLVAPVVATAVGVTYGWRYAVVTGFAIGVVVFVVFARGVHPTEPTNPEQSLRGQFTVETLAATLRRPSILFSLSLATVSMFAWQANASFLPTFLIEHREYSQSFAGLVFSMYFVSQGVLQVGVGSLSDRYGRDSTIALCLGASIVGYLLFVFVPGTPALFIGILFLGIGLSSQVAVMSRIFDHLSTEEKNTGFGLVRTVYLCVASLGSVVVGLIADLTGWATAFGFLAGLSGLALVAVAANHVFDAGY
jgi:MFS family permease